MSSPASDRQTASPQPSVSAEQRRQLIAEAAYSRAQQRNFIDGDPVRDWLEAERQIDATVTSPQQEETIVYEKLRAIIARSLAELREVADSQTIRRIFDEAAEEIRTTGIHAADTVAKVAGSVRKDMADAARRMGPRWEAFSEKSGDLFGIWRDRGSLFLADAALAVGEWLKLTGARLDQLTYRSGEIAYHGTFACVACNEQLTLAAPGHLPHCSKCDAREFRRVE